MEKLDKGNPAGYADCQQMTDSDSMLRLQNWRQAVAQCAPLGLLRRLAKPAPVCSCYHIVADEAPPHIRHLFTPRGIGEFARDLEFFARNFRPLPLATIPKLFDSLRSQRSSGFVVTFDDGLREAFEIAAPMLQQRSIQAVFFINPAFVDNRAMFYRHKASLLIAALAAPAAQQQRSRVMEYLADADIPAATPEAGILQISYDRQALLDDLAGLLEVDFADYLARQRPYMTRAQISQLAAAGHLIGAHSVDHPPFDSLPASEQLRQFDESLSYVQDHFASLQSVFAFPFHAKGLSPELLERSMSQQVTLFTTAGYGVHAASRKVDRITMERPGSARTLLNLALLKSLRHPKPSRCVGIIREIS